MYLKLILLWPELSLGSAGAEQAGKYEAENWWQGIVKCCQALYMVLI